MLQKGATLLELLIALSITLLIGAAVFQLFQQNERVFTDQNLLTEMQQGARAAIFQAADEIRNAGQGAPVFADTFGDAPSEETVAILSGSGATRINFRAGLAPAETAVTAPVPAILELGMPITVTADDATGLYNAVGGGPTGRFVFLWGASDAARWRWVRAAIRTITPSARSVNLTVTSTGPTGGSTVVFPSSPTMALEEAVALYLDSTTDSMRRTTATSMSDPVHPSWAPANELVSNVTQLHFDYYDSAGNSIIPDSLVSRSSIARVDIRLTVQTPQELRNHTRPTFALSVRTSIRNARIR